MIDTKFNFNWILFLWFLLISPVCFSQLSIHQIDEENISYTTIQNSIVFTAFNILHEFSEDLYQVPRIDRILSDSVIFQEKLWPNGSWGRGYFSNIVDNRESPTPNWKYYDQWYENIYSSHPLIRDSGKRILGYIYACNNAAFQDSLFNFSTRISSGLQYLIAEQYSDGGWQWWYKRKSKSSSESIEILKSNIYESSIALRALSKGHIFFQNNNEYSELCEQIFESIDRACEFMLSYKDLLTEGKYNINNRMHVVWAMVGAYKITKRAEYLEFAMEITRSSFLYQQEDGSWHSPIPLTKGPNYKWHDTKSDYHGMILRGLVELYSVVDTTDSNFQKKLEDAIYNSINHVIDYNDINGEINTRLFSNGNKLNGCLYHFHRDNPKYNSKNSSYGNYILQSMLLVKENIDLNNEDKNNVDKLIDLLSYGLTNIIMNNPLQRFRYIDVDFHTLGMYLGVNLH